MMSGDFEGKLDEALSRLRNGEPLAEIAERVPDAADLLHAAQRIQILSPAPLPNLAAGRNKFLIEAARVNTRQLSLNRTRQQLIPRRALALASIAVFVLIVGGTIALAAGSILAGFPGAPAWWLSSTPTMRPTYTATPTQISLAPIDANQFQSSLGGKNGSRASLPSPNPAPQAAMPVQISK
jgi:hypothetical protein